MRNTVDHAAIAALAQSHGVQQELDRRAQRTQQIAQQLCPVRTGRLRDSIEIERDGDGRRIGSKLNYAIYVEVGTRHEPAQPYLRPALQAAMTS